MTVPKLRFKEFDEEWSSLKYKDVLTIKYGKDHKLLTDGDIPVYGTGGIMRHVDRYLYEGESILIGRKGTIDQPKYVNEKFWTVDTLFYTEIKQNAVPKFLFQHALQVNWLGLNEATGVPSLNTTSINNVDISFPPIQEQKKIASFLSAADEKISQLNQKHRLLCKYKQGMMQKLFSQQLRFKADDGSEFRGGGEITLGEIIKFVNGKGHENDVDEHGDYTLINSKFISTDGFISKNVNKCHQKVINDCLVMVMSDIPNGKALAKVLHITDGSKFALNQRIGMFLFPKENCPKFFQYQLNRHKYYLSFDSGVGQTNLKKEDVLGCPIFIPCLEEQTQIANFLSAIDQKIEVVAQQIEQAKTWKKGLLQQMFV